jgi:hypothetical protein
MQLLGELGLLMRVIPQIKSYRFGCNDSDNSYNQTWPYAFVMDFLTKEDRYIYQQHPAHLDFIETFLNPIIADALVFDMENHFVPLEESCDAL